MTAARKRFQYSGFSKVILEVNKERETMMEPVEAEVRMV